MKDCAPVNSTYALKTRVLKVDYLNDSFDVEGQFEVLQVLPMNAEFEISLSKCRVDGRGCFKLPKVVYPRICSKLETSTSFFYVVMEGIKPRPHCPVQIGTYELMMHTKIDILKYISMDDSIWKIEMIGIEKKASKIIRSFTCLHLEIQIIKNKLKM
jgi:hypothetical protein